MKPSFGVRVVGFSVLQQTEGVWSSADYRALLEATGFDDMAGMNDAELQEMCLVALQELPPEQAAAIVLKHHLGDRLTEGQIRNVSNELQDEKLWEEYADMSLHERLFHVGSLLYAAQPQSFPDPDAVQVKLEVVANNGVAKDILSRPLSESFLTRLLADGMDDDSTLHRLFDEQLAGKAFAEADSIVWIVNSEANGVHAIKLDVISSGYWLDALREAKSYESSAHPDTLAEAAQKP